MTTITPNISSGTITETPSNGRSSRMWRSVASFVAGAALASAVAVGAYAVADDSPTTTPHPVLTTTSPSPQPFECPRTGGRC